MFLAPTIFLGEGSRNFGLGL